MGLQKHNEISYNNSYLLKKKVFSLINHVRLRLLIFHQLIYLSIELEHWYCYNKIFYIVSNMFTIYTLINSSLFH